VCLSLVGVVTSLVSSKIFFQDFMFDKSCQFGSDNKIFLKPKTINIGQEFL
jgi:hypothetical protein